MGTRGLMGIRIDGVDKLTYNHFDSYPDSLGADMARDVRVILDADTIYGIEWLRDMARNIRLVDEESKPSKMDIALLHRYTDLGVGIQSEESWYCLTRNLQGELLGTLKAGIMIDNHDFMNDSLFCEWAYIVNLDSLTFEVYEGFKKEPHDKGRYASETKNENGYYPCALVKEYPIESVHPEQLYDLLDEEGDIT